MWACLRLFHNAKEDGRDELRLFGREISRPRKKEMEQRVKNVTQENEDPELLTITSRRRTKVN